MKLIIVGAPGAGKGTQALMLSEKYNIPHISSGDIFRSNIKQGTELGIKAREYIDRGMLVPDDLTLDIVMDRLSRPDCADGYILDGFPRTIPQAEQLDAALRTCGEDITCVIDIEVPDGAIIERMAGRRVCPSCGDSYHIHNKPAKVDGICDRCGEKLVTRADDNAETVKKRLLVYHEQTHPLIEYYEKRGKLAAFDGTAQVDEVFDSIVRCLGE